MTQATQMRAPLLRHVPPALLAVLVGCVSPTAGWAQSRLPPCPTDQSAYYNNCFGTYTSPDGSKYVGEWRDDKRTGQGTETWPNGEKYVGEYRDDKRNGQGTNTWPDGGKYVGEFRDDKQNGQGTRTWPDGGKYVGEFRDDKRTGQGTRTWFDGAKYVGEFRDDKRNGQGTLTLPDGEKYVGEYRDGKRTGQGTLYAANGRVLQSGSWLNDDFVGAVAPAPYRPPVSAGRTDIPLIKEGGTFKVPVLINGIIALHFTVDSGAAHVSIPADVVMTLVRTGTITDNDFLGDQTYVLADGSRVKSKTFRIRSLKVGDRVVENVLGSVADVKGSLLLGQSFLSRFKAVKFDYARQVLVLE